LRGFKKNMCDPVLIAAILEELGYFDNKKEKDKSSETSDKEGNKGSLQDSGVEDQKQKITHLFMPDPRNFLAADLLFVFLAL